MDGERVGDGSHNRIRSSGKPMMMMMMMMLAAEHARDPNQHEICIPSIARTLDQSSSHQ
jgi:hypothetical protein